MDVLKLKWMCRTYYYCNLCPLMRVKDVDVRTSLCRLASLDYETINEIEEMLEEENEH